jgi:hypothetical protein
MLSVRAAAFLVIVNVIPALCAFHLLQKGCRFPPQIVRQATPICD